MVKNSKFEHEFLDLKNEGMDDRTFLGGLRLGARTFLFWVTGLAVLIILGGFFMHVDQRVAAAMDDWRVAREASILITRTQFGLARAEALEKKYVLEKKRGLADEFSSELMRVGTALDTLYEFPQTDIIRQHIATLRDGLEQYGQQFTLLVTAEEALDLTTTAGSGLRLETLTSQLRNIFNSTGFVNLSNQIVRITRQGSETLWSGGRERLTEIRERYRTLFASFNASKTPAAEKTKLEKLLQAHQRELMSIINRRFVLERERRRFGEILAYVAPSTDALSKFSTELDLSASMQLVRERDFARYFVGSAIAIIFLWFLVVGLLLMHSIVSPLQALAFTAARLANGDHGTLVPARGNFDETGQIARALAKWIDDLVKADMLRCELEKVRALLEFTLAEADSRVRVEQEPFEGQLERADPGAELQTAPTLQSLADITYAADLAGSGSISSVSQKLAHFSQHLTTATSDVERTELLIRSLGEAISHIEILGGLVKSVYDQANLLIVSSPSPGNAQLKPETLIPFSSADSKAADGAPFNDLVSDNRLDRTLESTDRTLQTLRTTMDSINAIAHEIAMNASEQALTATKKLLSQSQHLQNMLDDIMTKIEPNTGNRLVSPLHNPVVSGRPEDGLPPREA